MAPPSHTQANYSAKNLRTLCQVTRLSKGASAAKHAASHERCTVPEGEKRLPLQSRELHGREKSPSGEKTTKLGHPEKNEKNPSPQVLSAKIGLRAHRPWLPGLSSCTAATVLPSTFTHPNPMPLLLRDSLQEMPPPGSLLNFHDGKPRPPPSPQHLTWTPTEFLLNFPWVCFVFGYLHPMILVLVQYLFRTVIP